MFPRVRWLGFLLGLALAGPALAGEGAVVNLNSGVGWCIGGVDAPRYGLLTRELARQAFLIAAREECGAATQDAWLGDSMPETGGDPPFDLLASPGKLSLLEVVRGFGSQQRSIWRQELSVDDAFDYPQYVARMEKMSRDQFVRVLEQEGFKRTHSDAKIARGGLPAEVANRLNEMTFTSQFAALRQLHARRGSDGDNAARLAGLARGYANLGVLSEYFWNPMHQVFKARALLYAERLVASDSRSPWALAHRAYARALVGLHGAALADLEAAQLGAQASQQELPPWTDLLADFCRFDASAVKAVSGPSERQLAAVLRLVMAEQSDEPALVPRAARAESTNAPECYRICDGYLLSRGYDHPDEREKQPENGSAVLAKTLYKRLQEIPGLPPAVDNAIQSNISNELARREAVIRALLVAAPHEAADERDEFSWAVLGRMIREVSFYQAWREIRPDASMGGDQLVIKLRPAYSQHRYAGFLEMGQQDPTEHRKGYRKFLENVDGEAFEFQMWPLTDFMIDVNVNFQSPYFTYIVRRRMDDVGRDLARRIQNDRTENSLPAARTLLAVSPYHPIARAKIIEFEWNRVRDQAADWEHSSATQPAVLRALSKRYAAANNSQAAERLLRAVAEAAPTASNVALQAAQFKRAGNHEAWLKTMERLASLPDVPDRGQVEAAITDVCMARGEWQRAHEHADAAIEAGTTAGLLGGADFYEAQQLWAFAETQYRKASEGDPAAAFEWYFFCKRTGQGDAQAARKVAAKYMNDREALKNEEPLPYLYMQILPGTYNLLANKPETARLYFEGEFFRDGDPFCGLQAALISDRLKDPKRRDQRLAEIGTRHAGWMQHTPLQPHREIAALAALFAADLSKKGDGDLDLNAVGKLLATSTEIEQINCQYFVGEYLHLHGKPEKAIDPWLKCMTLLPLRAANRTLAGSALIEEGVTPDMFKTSIKDRTVRPAASNPLKN